MAKRNRVNPSASRTARVQAYTTTGDHYSGLELDAVILLSPISRTQIDAQTREVYKRVIRDIIAVDDLLLTIIGRPIIECPQSLEYPKNGSGYSDGANGYQFRRVEGYMGGNHLIDIRRSKDNFILTIGVGENSSNDISGYYFVSTNGNLSDMTEAINATSHFFPTPFRNGQPRRDKFSHLLQEAPENLAPSLDPAW